jgi:hypothetical protein
MGYCDGAACNSTTCQYSGEFERRKDPKYKKQAELGEKQEYLKEHIDSFIEHLIGIEYLIQNTSIGKELTKDQYEEAMYYLRRLSAIRGFEKRYISTLKKRGKFHEPKV